MKPRTDRCPICHGPVPSNRVARFIGDALAVVVGVGIAATLLALTMRLALWILS